MHLGLTDLSTDNNRYDMSGWIPATQEPVTSESGWLVEPVQRPTTVCNASLSGLSNNMLFHCGFADCEKSTNLGVGRISRGTLLYHRSTGVLRRTVFEAMLLGAKGFLKGQTR
jgi:hypothetical protein